MLFVNIKCSFLMFLYNMGIVAINKMISSNKNIFIHLNDAIDVTITR